MKVDIIEFAGHIGSGKTTIAKKLVEKLKENPDISVIKLAFADYLKRLLLYLDISKGLTAAINLDETFSYRNWLKICEDVESAGISTKKFDLSLRDEFKKRLMQKLITNRWNIDRYAMQIFGDIFRERDKNFWVKALLMRMNTYINHLDKDIIFVIDDYRFPNEDLSNYLDVWFTDEEVTVCKYRILAPISEIINRLKMSKEEYIRLLSHESEKYINWLFVDEEIENVGDVDQVTELVKDWYLVEQNIMNL